MVIAVIILGIVFILAAAGVEIEIKK